MGGKDWGNKRARLQRLQKGDLVKARVTKIDRAQGKAWISLDADVFEDDSEEEEEGFGVSQDSSEEDATGENDDSRSIENAEWGREEQAVDVDVQVEKPRKKNAKNKRMGESEEESPENDGDFSTDEGEETGGSWSAGLSAGDTWGWTETGPSEDNGTSRREGFVSDSEGEDPPELSDVEESEEKRSKAARRRHEEEARRNEEDTRRLEDNAGRSWMEDPRSPEDFERLVLVNGNSAAVWIRQVDIAGKCMRAYMAYYLKLNELQLARQIAERAVQHINYREEQERSSVWIAYLNLECVYGDRVDDVFRRAIQYNDSKKIHYQMTFIYEKARQLDKARQMCEKCCEKFPESQKMWVRHLTLLYTALDAASAARDLMLQALFRLPRRKHIEFVATCARLEYKHASKERGQTFFEKLLAEHPKRTDIWSQYVDAHIAAHTPPRCVPANLQSIRVLFERTTSLQLKLRKMKFFFTRWLDFEKQHGTAETQARVRAKAREFVQSVENKIRHTN
uniref:Ribosomal protein S1-like protein,putative n=1 Tax=Toxoplasma gondii (strain ATCC 50861 / VEG) TaxID=432359 RepID=A0A0F7V2A2_TOXGV|nr:TPA: Ribosomal protein S1-like protein,putative [Toxoplasma gondii VEG]